MNPEVEVRSTVIVRSGGVFWMWVLLICLLGVLLVKDFLQDFGWTSGVVTEASFEELFELLRGFVCRVLLVNDLLFW